MARRRVRRISLLVVLVILGYVFGVVSTNSLLSAKPIKKIEYKIIFLDDCGASSSCIEEKFNEMAAQGWEVVEWRHQDEALLKRSVRE